MDNRKHLIRFDPPVPDTSIVHVYISGEESCILAANNRLKDEVNISAASLFTTSSNHNIDFSSSSSRSSSGQYKVGIFTKLRPVRTSNPGNVRESYFELNLGTINGGYTTGLWVSAYRKFASYI